jgi:hypothetical protein
MNAPHLTAALGEALRQLAGELEALGGALCEDPALAEAHLAGLQRLDWCAQSLVQIAHVIEAPDPAAAVAAVTLGDLRARLTAACHTTPACDPA